MFEAFSTKKKWAWLRLSSQSKTSNGHQNILDNLPTCNKLLIIQPFLFSSTVLWQFFKYKKIVLCRENNKVRHFSENMTKKVTRHNRVHTALLHKGMKTTTKCTWLHSQSLFWKPLGDVLKKEKKAGQCIHITSPICVYQRIGLTFSPREHSA